MRIQIGLRNARRRFWSNRWNRLIAAVGVVVVIVEVILGAAWLSMLTDRGKDSGAAEKPHVEKPVGGDEPLQENCPTPNYSELASEICDGKRMTYPQFKERLDELEEKLGKKLNESGYWAYRFEGQDALRIMVGETEGGLEGSIQEGLNGGFTYPAWLPARDAKYIWEQFFLLKRIEESFLRSPFLMSAKEERRLKEEIAKDPRVERERLAYAKKKLAPLVLDIERYVYVQRKYLCVNAIEVVD